MSNYSKQRIPAYTWNGPAVAELDIIADVDSIGDYEWDVFMVLRDPETGRLYTYEGSGCSCNGPLEDAYSLDDLGGPYSLHEAAALAKKWATGEPDEAYMANRRNGLDASVIERLMGMDR